MREIAIVFGGTGAIGSAITQRLRSEGHAVYTVSRREGADIQCDVIESRSVEKAFHDVVVDVQRPPTILVNAFCAEPAKRPSIDVASVRYGADLFVDAVGAFSTCQEFARRAIPEGYGRIVNVSSIAAFSHRAERATYAGCKGAVLSMTQALAVEWAPSGLTVNCVLPALVDSPMGLGGIRDQEHLEQVKRRFPTRRLVTPEDVAAAVVFLTSRDAGQINGASLVVDGGWTLT